MFLCRKADERNSIPSRCCRRDATRARQAKAAALALLSQQYGGTASGGPADAAEKVVEALERLSSSQLGLYKVFRQTNQVRCEELGRATQEPSG